MNYVVGLVCLKYEVVHVKYGVVCLMYKVIYSKHEAVGLYLNGMRPHV